MTPLMFNIRKKLIQVCNDMKVTEFTMTIYIFGLAIHLRKIKKGYKSHK